METEHLLRLVAAPLFRRHTDRHSQLLIVGGGGSVGNQDFARLQPIDEGLRHGDQDEGSPVPALMAAAVACGSSTSSTNLANRSWSSSTTIVRSGSCTSQKACSPSRKIKPPAITT